MTNTTKVDEERCRCDCHEKVWAQCMHKGKLCPPCKGSGFIAPYQPDQTSDWRESLYRLDIGDPDSKGCTITLGEYLRVDCPELESFIQSLLSQQEQRHQREMREAWDKAEKHGILPQPNPFGRWVSIPSHNGVIKEMKKIFLDQISQSINKLSNNKNK